MFAHHLMLREHTIHIQVKSVSFANHLSAKTMKCVLSAIFIFTSLISFAQKTISEKSIQEFDRYVARVKEEWNVPGLSITVVKDGKIIFKKGYGVRELGKSEQVDTQTLFACASTTKAMTVVVLGMLVDEGKLSWDDKVTKFVPQLQLYDPYVTRELRVRDLLTHSAGLPSTNFLTGMMRIPATEMFNKLVYVKPQYSFRGGFEYQNTMYTLAGRVIENITGKKWPDVMNEKLFIPLGMKNTVPKRSWDKTGNMTKPHYPVNNEIKVLDYDSDSEIGAAGGVWSNAGDISLWAMAMLDSSKYAGGRLLKKETYAEIFKPQVIFPEDEYPSLTLIKPNWRTYGLGWYQHDYKGKKVNFHTGSLNGLTAIIGLLPEENFGVFVFGNSDHAEVRHALMYKAFDQFALNNTTDWNPAFKKLYTALNEAGQKQQKAFEAKRITNTKPSLALKEYEGTYTSDLYGKVEIKLKGDQLEFDVNNQFIVVQLPHWHYDTFYGGTGKYGQYKMLADFDVDASGKASKLRLNGMEFNKK